MGVGVYHCSCVLFWERKLKAWFLLYSAHVSNSGGRIDGPGKEWGREISIITSIPRHIISDAEVRSAVHPSVERRPG